MGVKTISPARFRLNEAQYSVRQSEAASQSGGDTLRNGESNMKGTMRREEIGCVSAIAGLVSRVLIIVLAMLLVPALAAAPSSRSASKANPRLASVEIEIWPEFDRPAVLVILKGELATDIALPAPISLRIPASSGGPTAVAYATPAKAELLNLKYDRADAGDFITLRFEVPGRLFHVEFYDPLVTNTPERGYTYLWPGDFATDRLAVIFQEPAAASNFSLQPNLEATATGQDGLSYRSAELGAFKAGKQLPIKVRYTKTDSRTSSEIVKPIARDSSASTVAGFAEGIPDWIPILVALAVLFIGAGAAFLWWRPRKRVSAPQSSGTAFCSKCGNPLALGDRFCSKCGAPVR